MLTSSTCEEEVKNILPIFAEAGVPVAFLVLTETGFKKSIMDAVAPLRNLLYNAGLHNYETQLQGPEYKKIIKANIVTGSGVYPSKASLYRPVTKKGDPRIWFTGLKKYCKPNDVIAVISLDNELFIFVMNKCISDGFLGGDSIYRNGALSFQEFPRFSYQLSMDNLKPLAKSVLDRAISSGKSIASELLKKIEDIHKQGYIRGINHGDTAVGMTLEHCLGIPPNDSKLPDYKGIELKASRLGGNDKQKNRLTLFTQVPDWKANGMSELKLLQNYGYWGKDKDGEKRWNLYCTVSNVPNPQGLFLANDVNHDLLINYFVSENSHPREVVQWNLELLRQRTLEKHHETFWVKAKSKFIDGIEYFRYDTIIHTKHPNAHLFGELAGNGDITMDYTIHLKDDQKHTRNHGYIFKIKPTSFKLMFPEPDRINLDHIDW